MARAYTPIGWENGTKEAEAYVTISGVDYEVTPEQWDGNTPVDATNLDHMEKGIQNSYDVKLLAVTDTEPSECVTGDVYYNTTNKLLYTATGTDTWSSTGTEPLEGILYIVFDEENNQGNSYSWNGTDLSSVGGGGGGADEVIISDEEPTTDDWKIWIDSGQTENLGSEITNTYSTSEHEGYSCNYLNSKEYALNLQTFMQYNNFQSFKTGKVANIIGYFGSVYTTQFPLSTWTKFADLPSEMKPKSEIRGTTFIINADSGSYVGTAIYKITTTGTMEILPFVTNTNHITMFYINATYLTN